LLFSIKVSNLGLDPGLGLALRPNLWGLGLGLALRLKALAWVLPAEVLALTLQALLTSLSKAN